MSDPNSTSMHVTDLSAQYYKSLNQYWYFFVTKSIFRHVKYCPNRPKM